MPPTLTGADTGEPALTAAIEAVPGWERADTVRSTSLSAGITNRNYLLESGDERVVVRVFGADTELLGIDRVAEDVAARAAADAGVGPPVLAFLPEAGCLVTRFVDGAPVPVEDLERVEIVGAVVRSVRAIHGCPPLPSVVPGLPHRRGLRGARERARRAGAARLRGGSRPGRADRAAVGTAPRRARRATTIC